MKRSTLLSSAAIVALSSTLALAEGTQRQDRQDQSNAPAAQQQPASPNGSSGSSPSTQPQSQQRPASNNAANQPSQQQPGNQNAQQQRPAQSNQNAQQQRPARTNQNAQQQPAQTNQNAQQQQPAQTNQNAQQQPAQTNQQPAQRSTQSPSSTTQQGAQAPQSGRSTQAAQGAATTAQQRTQIATTIRQQNVTPVRVNFALRLGVSVPTTVRLSALPDTIVSIVPQYRGYSYFVTDERIIIVEPSSHKIVEVLPFEGGGRAAAAPAQRKVQFSNEQRQTIRKHAVEKRTVTTGSGPRTRIVVEDEVPSSVELEEFSDVVVREVPSVRSYRYYRNDNDVIVVDPGSRRVIDVIE